MALAKVIGAYGSGARPILTNSAGGSVLGFSRNAGINLIITQLDIEAATGHQGVGVGITFGNAYNNAAGQVVVGSDGTNVLIEDVKVNGFQKNMDLEDVTNLMVRRSEITNACGAYRAQGIYFATNKGVLLDENFMDNNGLQTCGVATSGSPQAQGVYSQIDESCFRATGNVMSRSLGNTLEDRTGGVVTGNVFVGSQTALNFGECLGGCIEGKQLPRGVYGSVSGNLFVNNQQGVVLANTAQASFDHNIMIDNIPAEGAIVTDGHIGIGLHGLSISSNVVYGAKYFVSYQWSLPQPVIMKNDGSETQWQDCDGVFKNSNAVQAVTVAGSPEIWQYVSTPAPAPSPKPTNVGCYNGLSVNGADLYSLTGTKLVDSTSTGIVMSTTESPVTFTAPDVLQSNLVGGITNTPFEMGQTTEKTNPAPSVAETGDNLAAAFVNPAWTTPSTLYGAMAAQSHDNWDASITAAVLISQAQAAFKVK